MSCKWIRQHFLPGEKIIHEHFWNTRHITTHSILSMKNKSLKQAKKKEKLYEPSFYWFALMFLISKSKEGERGLRLEGKGQSFQ